MRTGHLVPTVPRLIGGSSAALSWSIGKAGVKAFADAKGYATTY